MLRPSAGGTATAPRLVGYVAPAASSRVGSTSVSWCGVRRPGPALPRRPAGDRAGGRSCAVAGPSAVVPDDPPSAEQLLAAVREARATGVATAFGETIHSVNTAAARADGRIAATLSVTGPSTRLDDLALARCVPLLRETAEAVSVRLGHRP